MKTCTTFCIFYCRPCNLWNVCTREPTRNIRKRATRYTYKKKCDMQNTKTFDWMVRAFSIARTIGAGRMILFSELVVASYAYYTRLYISDSFLIHLAIHLYIAVQKKYISKSIKNSWIFITNTKNEYYYFNLIYAFLYYMCLHVFLISILII